MCVFRQNRLKDVKKAVVFNEGVWSWREFGSGADGEVSGGRFGGQEGEDVGVGGELIGEYEL